MLNKKMMRLGVEPVAPMLDITKVNEEKKQLFDMIKNLTDANEAKENKITSLEKELTNERTLKEDANKKLIDLINEKNIIHDKYCCTAKDLEDVTNQKGEIFSKYCDLKDQFDHCDQTSIIQEMQVDQNLLILENDNLKDEIIKLKEEKNKLETAVQFNKYKIVDLEDEIKTIAKNHLITIAELNVYKEKENKKLQEKAELEEKRKQHLELLNNHRAEIRALSDKINSLSS